jgi:hypothetical protein
MDTLSKLFASSSIQSLTLSHMLAVLGMAFLLGLFISGIYILTHKKEGYAEGFPTTLIMVPCIIAIIILLVGDSVASAFSLAGAFSLIRFRSAPGDPKDISYVFFTVAVGLACGMGYIGYAVLFAIFLCLIMLILNAVKFGKTDEQAMTLKITVPENLNFSGLFDDVLNKYTKVWNLKRVKTTEFGSLFEVVYNIKTSRDMAQKEFLDEIRTLNGNLNIVLTISEYDDKGISA